MKALPAAALLASLAALSACAETTVTILTQAPPGRTAAVDIEAETLTLSQGLAVAFECVEWTEAYAGPCRDLGVRLGDDDLAEVLPVHLDAFASNRVSTTSGTLTTSSTIAGPSDRQGAVLAAIAAGSTRIDVVTAGAPVSLTLIVEEPPGPSDNE